MATWPWSGANEDRCRHPFHTRYARPDIGLLAQVDEALETCSGPATRRILQRELSQYGKPEFQRLATISNGPLYSQRGHPLYHQRLNHYQKTRSIPVARAADPIPGSGPAIGGWIRCTKLLDSLHKSTQKGAIVFCLFPFASGSSTGKTLSGDSTDLSSLCPDHRPGPTLLLYASGGRFDRIHVSSEVLTICR